MPLTDFFLIMGWAWRRCFPEHDLREASNRFIRSMNNRIQHNPMFRTLRQAAGDNLGAYIELTTSTDSGNYGRDELTKLGPTHYEVTIRPDRYPELMRLIAEPYYEELLGSFNVKGTVRCELDDISGLRVDIRWRG